MASGTTLVAFNAHSNNPPATNYATIATRNSQLVLNFDAGTNESADFAGVLPRNYGGGGFTMTIVWTAATATTGNVVWNAAIERQNEGANIGTDSFAAAQSVTAAAPGTSGLADYATITFTDGAQIDSLAVGESFRLRITRDAVNAGDNMAGDAQLVRVEIRET